MLFHSNFTPITMQIGIIPVQADPHSPPSPFQHKQSRSPAILNPASPILPYPGLTGEYRKPPKPCSTSRPKGDPHIRLVIRRTLQLPTPLPQISFSKGSMKALYAFSRLRPFFEIQYKVRLLLFSMFLSISTSP